MPSTFVVSVPSFCPSPFSQSAVVRVAPVPMNTSAAVGAALESKCTPVHAMVQPPSRYTAPPALVLPATELSASLSDRVQEDSCSSVFDA